MPFSSRLQAMIDANARVLLSTPGFFCVVTVYLLVLYLLRTYAFSGGSVDDAEALFYAQAFRWGTIDDHPPLPHWLNLWSEWFLGAGVPAVMAVKFLSFFATYTFMFLAAREALRDTRLAALSALSIVSFYVWAWEAVLDFLHVVVLAPTIPATLYALLLLERRPGVGVYAGLGLAVGAGFMSKYGYGLFFVPLTVAAAMDPVLRPRLLSRRILVSMAVALAMLAPHLLWKINNMPGAGAEQWYAAAGSGVAAAFSGLSSAGWQALVFLSPFVFVFAALFPSACRRLPKGAGGPDAVRRRLLLERSFLVFALFFAAIIIGLQMASVRTHWMMVLIPLPIYAFLRVQAAGVEAKQVRRFAAILTLLALAVIIAVAPRWLTGPWVCNKCTFFIPYATLAQQLREAGFAGGTIIAADDPVPVGPNLRRFFPSARVISTRYVGFRPPLGPVDPPDCLIVWNATRAGSAEDAMALARDALGVAVPEDAERRWLDASIPRTASRRARFGYVLLPDACGPVLVDRRPTAGRRGGVSRRLSGKADEGVVLLADG